MEFPCMLFLLFPCCFQYSFFCVCLIFPHLINMDLSMFLLGFTLYGTLHFLNLGGYFLSHVGEVFDYNLCEHFVNLFLCVFFFQGSCNLIVSGVIFVPEFYKTVFNSFQSFFFLILFSSDFHHSLLQLTYSFSCLSQFGIVLFWCIPSFQLFCFHLCLFVLQFFQISVKHFLYFLNPCLHSISNILNHLYYPYSKVFFLQVAYFLIYLVSQLF